MREGGWRAFVIRLAEGLTLETSASQMFDRGNLTLISSFIIINISLFSLGFEE